MLISLAMAYPKKFAEGAIDHQLAQVLENLAKIANYSVGPSTLQEWTDEIADKHVAVIHRIAHNVKRGKIGEMFTIAQTSIDFTIKQLAESVYGKSLKWEDVKVSQRLALRKAFEKYLKQRKMVLHSVGLKRERETVWRLVPVKGE